MLLKIKVGMAGPLLSLAPGDEHEFDEAEGLRLVAAGYAEPVVVESAEARVARLKAELAAAEAALPENAPAEAAPAQAPAPAGARAGKPAAAKG